MDLRRFKIFITAADTGNMTLAAQRLFISQPTVSQAVSELESHYQTKLFERFPKRLILTKSGQKLYEQALVVIEKFNELECNMKSEPGRPLLRLGATMTVGATVMSHLVSALKGLDSFLDIYVTVENTKDIEAKLLENQLDAAIVEGEINSPLVVTEPVINDCLVLVCGRDHHLANRTGIQLAELANESFIMREEGSGTRALFENVMRKAGLVYHLAWETSNTETIKQAVMRNHGLAVLSARLVARELATGLLKYIPVADCLWKRHFLLARHKDKNITEPLTRFMELSRSYEKYGLSCPMTQSELINTVDKFHLVE